jgi:hypothetical protein
MVPRVVLPPAVESTDQVTAVFVVLLTAAVNCCWAPSAIVAVAGATETITPVVGTIMFIVELADLVESATLVAVIVCWPVAPVAV